jgi:hypothetical protein
MSRSFSLESDIGVNETAAAAQTAIIPWFWSHTSGIQAARRFWGLKEGLAAELIGVALRLTRDPPLY